MVVDGGSLEDGGEGDLGGLKERIGASIGGSSAAVVLCEGVWLRDERWVMVGDTAGGARQSVSPCGCQLIVQSALMIDARLGYLLASEWLSRNNESGQERASHVRGGGERCADGEAECWIRSIFSLLSSLASQIREPRWSPTRSAQFAVSLYRSMVLPAGSVCEWAAGAFRAPVGRGQRVVAMAMCYMCYVLARRRRRAY
jgi:hypothetical protein